jgi:hypothetical protein
MEFEKRLQRAIERGQKVREAEGREQAAQALSEEELRSLHSKVRLDLSEHIERCLRKLVDYFPGFEFSNLVSEEGWGGKIIRDDIDRGAGRQLSRFYSRLEMLIRPYTKTHIVELVAKGAIRNKEVLSRTHYQMLDRVDVDAFADVIDQWIVEYAEKFAARP